MIHTPKNTRSNAQAEAQSKDGEEQRDEPISERKKKQKKKETMKKLNEELKVIKIQLDAVKRKLDRVEIALDENAEVPNLNRHFLRLQLKIIEEALAEYNAAQQRVYSLDVGDDAREEVEVMYIRFEQLYGELNVDALKNLELPVDGLEESMLINRITKKLDDETRKAWELNQTPNEMPHYESTMEFLKDRCRVLEKIRIPEKHTIKPSKFLKSTVEVKTKSSTLVATAGRCPQCSNSHELWKCDIFKKASLSDRYSTLRRIGACFNCLQKEHRIVECSSEYACKKCNRRHHTFLHPNETSTKKSENSAPIPTETKDDQPNRNRDVSSAGPSTSKPTTSKEERQSNFCA